MKILMPGVGNFGDRRKWVGTGTTIRLVVGSDEAHGRFYDLSVYWNERVGAQLIAPTTAERDAIRRSRGRPESGSR